MLRHAVILILVIGVMALGLPAAASVRVGYDYYAYATNSDGIPLMEDVYLDGVLFTQGVYTKTGVYGNYGMAVFQASHAAAVVHAECHAHGVEYMDNRFSTGTGRVESIVVDDELIFTVPPGSYPEGVTVGMDGYARGIITSGVGAGAEASLWADLGGNVYQSGLVVVGIDESGTIVIDEGFALSRQIVWPGTTLTVSTDFTVNVRLQLHRGWTWAVAYNTGAGYVTGDGSIDFLNDGRGLGIDNVTAPAGVVWTSASGLFMTAVSAASPPPATGPKLHQNHPNPFNPSTTITFALERGGPVDLEVYDVAGRLVRRLLQGEERPAGPGVVVWHGEDDHGVSQATGVYLYRLRTAQGERTRRMLLLK